MQATQPLAIGQKMLAHRLLASHCLSETECHAMWESCRSQGIEVGRATSLDRCVAEINQQMKPGFSLEIRAVGLKQHRGHDVSKNNNASKNNNNSSSSSKTVKYYAIVNSFPDDIVTKCFEKNFTQVEHNYLHRVLCKLVADAASLTGTKKEPGDDEDDDDDENRESDDEDGDQSSTSRTTLATLLNLRTEMPEAQRVTLAQAEATMEQLLEEKWLVATTTSSSSSPYSSKNGNNKKNKNKTTIQLGARAFMELSHYLVEECGMEKDDLPPLITFG